MEDSIQSWIKQAREANMSDDQIKDKLKQSGWTNEQIGPLLSRETLPANNPTDRIVLNQTVQSKKIKSFGSLLSSSLRVYQKYFKTLIIFSFIAFLPQFINLSLRFITTKTENTNIAGLWVGLSIPLYLISLLGIAALVFFINNPEVGSFKKGIYFAFHNFLSIIWVNIIVVAFILVGSIIIVPGIIWAITTSFSVYVFVAEGLNGLKAVNKSRDLAKGYWWAIFGRLFLYGLIIGIISFVLILIEVLTNITNIYVSQIIFMIFGLIVGPLGIILNFSIYQNLRLIKEKSS